LVLLIPMSLEGFLDPLWLIDGAVGLHGLIPMPMHESQI